MKKLESNKKAWAWFSRAAPSYQKVALYWVISAKKEETRRRRLDTLIADSAAGRKIASQARSERKIAPATAGKK
jgi:uncharacterized protein YdeI (YjbR/CyaY-like superfamily)